MKKKTFLRVVAGLLTGAVMLTGMPVSPATVVYAEESSFDEGTVFAEEASNEEASSEKATGAVSSQFGYIKVEYDEASEYGYARPRFINEKGEEVELRKYAVDASDDELSMDGEEAPLPPSYDLRKHGLVSGVEDQAITGTCWAHGAMAAVESNIIKQGYEYSDQINLSESQLMWHTLGAINENQEDRTYGEGLGMGTWAYNNGGSILISSPLLTAGMSCIDERNMIDISTFTDRDKYADPMSPYFPDLSCYDYLRGQSEYIVTDVDMFYLSPEFGEANMNDIKRHIMKNGVMDFSYGVFYDFDEDKKDRYFNEEHNAYYCDKDVINGQITYANHEIAVIGWDDDFSHKNFTIDPGENGAWICKNSWGTNWADNGFFYISYYDKTLYHGSDANSLVAEPRNYYGDIYTYSSSIGGFIELEAKKDAADNKVSIAVSNTFKADDFELLSKVGFYNYDLPNCDYIVRVYVDSYGEDPTSGRLKAEVSGTQVFSGYHTVDLGEIIPVEKDQVFSVVVILSYEDEIWYPIDTYHYNLENVAHNSQMTTYDPDTGFGKWEETGYFECDEEKNEYFIEGDAVIRVITEPHIDYKYYYSGNLYDRIKIVPSIKAGYPIFRDALIQFKVANVPDLELDELRYDYYNEGDNYDPNYDFAPSLFKYSNDQSISFNSTDKFKKANAYACLKDKDDKQYKKIECEIEFDIPNEIGVKEIKTHPYKFKNGSSIDDIYSQLGIVDGVLLTGNDMEIIVDWIKEIFEDPAQPEYLNHYDVDCKDEQKFLVRGILQNVNPLLKDMDPIITVEVMVDGQHRYEDVEVIVSANCTEPGKMKTKCIVCGEESTRVIEPLGHVEPSTYISEKAASCTEAGEKLYNCSRCHKDVTVIIAALGHKPSGDFIVEKEPTYTEDGSKYKLCSVCKEKCEITAIPKLLEETKKTVKEQNEKRNDVINEKAGTKAEPVVVEVKQSVNDTIAVKESYVKGKVKTRIIEPASDATVSMNVITVNAGTKFQLAAGKKGSYKIVEDSNGGIKSNGTKSKSAKLTSKGLLTVTAVKNVAKYSFVVEYAAAEGEAKYILKVNVENITFDKAIKNMVLFSKDGQEIKDASGNLVKTVDLSKEAITVSVNDISEDKEASSLISGVWTINVGKKGKEIASYELSEDGKSVVIKPVADKKGTVKITVAINGKKYTTAVKISSANKLTKKQKTISY